MTLILIFIFMTKERIFSYYKPPLDQTFTKLFPFLAIGCLVMTLVSNRNPYPLYQEGLNYIHFQELGSYSKLSGILQVAHHMPTACTSSETISAYESSLCWKLWAYMIINTLSLLTPLVCCTLFYNLFISVQKRTYLNIKNFIEESKTFTIATFDRTIRTPNVYSYLFGFTRIQVLVKEKPRTVYISQDSPKLKSGDPVALFYASKTQQTFAIYHAPNVATFG